MAKLGVYGFAGESRSLHPGILPETVGTVSLNQRPGYGDLRPWNSPNNVGVTVASGTKTIYRMNRTVPSDTNFWLRWPTVVHAVVGPNAAGSDERTYYTGSGTPKWTDLTKAIAGASYPNAFRELGVPAPTTAATVTRTPVVVAGTRTSETVFYVWTFVTDAGEESAPSPPSNALVIENGDTVSLSGMTPVPSGSYGINRIRIYRTKTATGASTEFFYLGEVVSTTTTFTDTGQTLGEVLPTATWITPPADLSNLTPMWNGMMAGISGNSVRVCEAYVPYAWPIRYEILPSDTKPLALSTFGQNLVILTNGKPILVTGSSPDALDEQPIEFLQACVSSESVVNMGTGVAYACPDGLAYVGAGGARLLTAGMMGRAEWQAIKPETIKGAMYENRYYGTYTVAAVTRMFMIDPANPSGMYFMDFGVDAMYVDELQDALYVLQGTSIRKWDTGTALTTTFKSKLLILPRPVQSFGWAIVRADAYPVQFTLDVLAIDPAEVTALVALGVGFTAIGTTGIRYTQSVSSNSPFRLPGGYTAREYQIQISGTSAVQSAFIAHGVAEFSQP
jgi:hypothetical protein